MTVSVYIDDMKRELESLLLASGKRSLIRVEGVRRDSLKAMAAWYESKGFLARAVTGDYGYTGRIRLGDSPKGAAKSVTLFVTSDSKTLKKAIELESTIRDQERSTVEKTAATREICAMMGMPDCCAEAYIRRGAFTGMTEYYLAQVLHAHKTPDPLLNPFTSPFFTCSTSCGAASDNIRTALRLLEQQSPGDALRIRKLATSRVFYWSPSCHAFLHGIYETESGLEFTSAEVCYDHYIPEASLSELHLDVKNLLAPPGGTLRITQEGVYATSREGGVFFAPRVRSIISPVLIDPEKQITSNMRQPTVMFAVMSDASTATHTINTTNVIAGSLKAMGADPCIRYFDVEGKTTHEITSEFFSVTDRCDPAIVVFNNTCIPSLLEAVRQCGARSVNLGESGGAPYDYVLSSYAQGRAVDFLQSLLFTSHPLRQPVGPDPMTLQTEGYHPLADQKDTGAPAPEKRVWRVGPECACHYRKPLAKNPIFQQIDPATLAKHYGCSFCILPLEKTKVSNTVKIVSHQIRKTLSTIPGVRKFSIYVPLSSLPRLSNMLTKRDFGIELYIESRVDDVIENITTLESIVDDLRAKKLRIVFHSVGFENLSPHLLALFNKDISPEQISTSILLLDGISLKHPDVFGFRESSNHGFILFTPWTTLEDLEINIEGIIKHRLYELVSDIFTSRLRLYPGTPLYSLADLHCCIEPILTQALPDTINIRVNDIPWVFLDQRTASVYRIFQSTSPRIDKKRHPRLFADVVSIVREGQHLHDEKYFVESLIGKYGH